MSSMNPDAILEQLIEKASRPFKGSLDVQWRTPDDCRYAKDRLNLLIAVRDLREALEDSNGMLACSTKTGANDEGAVDSQIKDNNKALEIVAVKIDRLHE